MQAFARHWQRIAVTLIPLVFALLHATGILPIGIINRLDEIIYDTRLRATMPNTLDDRIVIVDIDEKSLAEIGRWPWGRNKLALLLDKLFDQHQVALLGIDVVFAEPDDSSGLKQLKALAQNEWRDQPGFAERLNQMQGALDYDALFAQSLKNRPVVLGYYFTGDRDGRKVGLLPAPVMSASALNGRSINATHWNGYGANIEVLLKAAPKAGFFNALQDVDDGLVRSLPMLAEFDKQYYESLSLAMFRLLVGDPQVLPGFPQERLVSRSYNRLESLILKREGKTLEIPVTDRVAALVPYRGRGGVAGGSFRYLSAADILSDSVAAGSLKGKIILLGTTAPGLLDLRVTPVGEAYPGVEAHANVLSGMLDGKILIKPDYALGFEILILCISGLLLAFALPLLTATRAMLLSVLVMAGLVLFNFSLFSSSGLVLPLASALLTALSAFALNMSYGYFVESRSKRELARLFGTYVPPELVDEMVKDPGRYSMAASNKELTVLFCDMRGFTKMSEKMEPLLLQQLLNDVFSRLTNVIRANRGTIDKYMGDCVMAFWGAPVGLPNHAELAIKSALRMVEVIHALNQSQLAKGLPEIGIGIGLNTGMMCVGDMGSQERQAYTVIGDAVNLGSRLEGLSKNYGVEIVVSASTRKLGTDFVWHELDRVRVKGKQEAVAIYTPLGPAGAASPDLLTELKTWAMFLQSYRGQDWEQCDLLLLNLQRLNPHKYLYHLYQERLGSLRRNPPDPQWDGATNFDSK
ncbi:MAG: hypothetical protein RLZZ401_1948 [Pseudomonadota bacterium]|jgi:adenylate cyclase